MPRRSNAVPVQGHLRGSAFPPWGELGQGALRLSEKNGIFEDMSQGAASSDPIETKALRIIQRTGRGWAFSQRDLASLGNRAAIDKALQRLTRKRRIRRIVRGVYDYPRFSRLLGQELGPDTDQVAQALARKFGWRIQPSGPSAQNIIGLSTQVPARIVYLSDGPERSYQVGKTALVFKHIAPKETGFKYRESALIVQAFKSLGADRITPQTIATVRAWLDPKMRWRVLADTRTATGWVYAAIRQVTREDSVG